MKGNGDSRALQILLEVENLFGSIGYRPLHTTGAHADNVVVHHNGRNQFCGESPCSHCNLAKFEGEFCTFGPFGTEFVQITRLVVRGEGSTGYNLWTPSVGWMFVEDYEDDELEIKVAPFPDPANL